MSELDRKKAVYTKVERVFLEADAKEVRANRKIEELLLLKIDCVRRNDKSGASNYKKQLEQSRAERQKILEAYVKAQTKKMRHY